MRAAGLLRLSLAVLADVLQKEMLFDESLVLQQLRYTGMLETVRIRRSGYSAKYTFQVRWELQMDCAFRNICTSCVSLHVRLTTTWDEL